MALVLTACSSQTVIGQMAQADEATAGSVNADAGTEVAQDVEPPTTDAGEAGGQASATETSNAQGDASESGAIPAGWVGVPGRERAPSLIDFDDLLDRLAQAPGLQTTVLAALSNFGAQSTYTTVRQSNAGESGGLYRSNSSFAPERATTRLVANGVVWSEDKDKPNLYVGVEAREDDAQLTNHYLLTALRDATVDVVGFEQDADGSARWYLLIEPTAFMIGFDDWDPTGTVFDFGLGVANVDTSGMLTSIDLDVSAATFVRYLDEQYSTPPRSLRFDFETFDERLPLGQPCDEPTASIDARSRSVLHCPIDSGGYVAPHVAIGYLDDPTVASSTYLVAEILEQLGYSVDVVPLTEGVQAAYDDLATNNIDLYASAWFPADQVHLARPAADGATVGDLVARFDGALAPAGGVSSMVVTTDWAEAEGILSVGDINADAALWGEIDKDGNGKGEIEGCPVGHACRPWLEAQVASVWTNLELTDRSFDQAYEDLLLARLLGRPALAVATLPNAWFNNAFGDWSVLSTSAGIAGFPEDIFGTDCFEAAYPCEARSMCRTEPCSPVFATSDLEIVASAAWASANPVGVSLVEQVTVDAAWLHAVVDEAASHDREMLTVGVNQYRADDAAENWAESNQGRIQAWIDAALALDPSFGLAPVEEEPPPLPQPSSVPDIDSAQRSVRNEGDLVAWEEVVLGAVQASAAGTSGDSTELLSLGAAAVCEQTVEAQSVMQLFDAAQERFVDLESQIGPFLGLIQKCDLKPSSTYLRVTSAGSEAQELPAGVDQWSEFIEHVQQAGTPWGSFDDVEIMAARSCIGGYPRLADSANGYSIGHGMVSTSQMKELAALLDAGCLLGSDELWRPIVLFDSGRDELHRVFGEDAVSTLSETEFDCMVHAAASLGRPPVGVNAVAAMAPLCAPAMVIAADTIRYTSEIVDAATARCIAEGLVGLAVASRDPSKYYGRWLSPVYEQEQALVKQAVSDTCGLTEAQIEDVGIRGL